MREKNRVSHRGTEDTEKHGGVFVSSIFLRVLHASVRYFLYTSVCSLLLPSCGEPEKPMPVIPEPVLQSIEINTGNQATYYYSLSQKKIIASNKITDWDLRFSAAGDKYFIFLNSAKNMRIARYDGKFSDTIHSSGTHKWQTDLMKDGTCISAIGNWGDFSFTNPKSFGYTYIVDLGYLKNPNQFGYRKIEVLGFTNNHYTLKFGLLDDPDGDTIQIEKKAGFNNVFFQLGTGLNVDTIEPPAAAWDLEFTQYGLASPVIQGGMVVDTSFENTDMILLNNVGRQIAIDTVKAFKDITFWDAEDYIYANSLDFIGNKWRFYNPFSNQYEVSKKNIYIVKTNDNRIYKIELKSVDKTIPGITKIEFWVKNL